MKRAQPGEDKQGRLTPGARRDQIIDVAAEVILAQGHLPLNLETLARAAGISKALVYAVFHTQYDLFNAILEREFRALTARGLIQASALQDLTEAALGCALAYFDHVAANGPLIHVILRDPYMARRVDPQVARIRDRIIRRLAHLARGTLKLRAKENIAAINLVVTIPEEAGRLVHAGTLTLDRGRRLCSQLVSSSLDEFTPRRA